MLILSRRVKESIQINDDIKVTILSTTSKIVKLGVEAPKNVSVHREEIYERIKQKICDRRDKDFIDQN